MSSYIKQQMFCIGERLSCSNVIVSQEEIEVDDLHFALRNVVHQVQTSNLKQRK